MRDLNKRHRLECGSSHQFWPRPMTQNPLQRDQTVVKSISLILARKCQELPYLFSTLRTA
jgi:hypothetical protein